MGFRCHLLSMLQLQLGTWGGTHSNFSDKCINALRRAGPCRHSQAQLFIASRSNHSTPERPFLTSKNCSQPCAPQNEPISKLMMPVTVQPSLNLMWSQPFFKLAHPSLKFGTILQDPVCPQDVQGVSPMSMGRVLIHQRGSKVKG